VGGGGGGSKGKGEENLVVLLLSSCEGVRAGEGEKDRRGSEMKKKVGCVASKIAVLQARLLCCVGAVLWERWWSQVLSEQEENYKRQQQQEQKLID